MTRETIEFNIAIGDESLKFEVLSLTSQMLTMNVWVNGVNLCNYDNSHYIYALANDVKIDISYLIKTENWFEFQEEIKGASLEETVANFIKLREADVEDYSVLDWGPPLKKYKSFLVPYLDELFLASAPTAVFLEGRSDLFYMSKFNKFESIQKLMLLQSYLMEFIQRYVKT